MSTPDFESAISKLIADYQALRSISKAKNPDQKAAGLTAALLGVLQSAESYLKDRLEKLQAAKKQLQEQLARTRGDLEAKSRARQKLEGERRRLQVVKQYMSMLLKALESQPHTQTATDQGRSALIPKGLHKRKDQAEE